MDRIEALSYWVVSDHFEELGRPPALLHGGFGLRTVGELRKPRWWALALLERLDDTRVRVSMSGDGAGSLIEPIATRDESGAGRTSFTRRAWFAGPGRTGLTLLAALSGSAGQSGLTLLVPGQRRLEQRGELLDLGVARRQARVGAAEDPQDAGGPVDAALDRLAATRPPGQRRHRARAGEHHDSEREANRTT